MNGCDLEGEGEGREPLLGVISSLFKLPLGGSKILLDILLLDFCVFSLDRISQISVRKERGWLVIVSTFCTIGSYQYQLV